MGITNFDQVYKDHYNLVCSIARKFVNKNDVQDCAQEIMLRLWRYQDTLKDERKIFYFVYSVARNTSINYAKSQSIRALSKAGELDDDLYVEHYYDDWWEEVARALSKTDPMIRDVTMLKLQGYSQKEVSAKLGVGRKDFYAFYAKGKEYLIEELL